MVHPEGADIAEGIADIDADVLVLLQHGHEIGDRVLPPVDLTVLQGGGSGGRIRHHQPLDAIDQDVLAAGKPRRLLLPRHVIGELLEHRLGAGHPFALGELHRTRADIFGDLLERIRLRDALGHDEGARRVVLGQRVQHFRERLLQDPFEGAVVDRSQFLLDREDHQTHWIARGPARQARDDVLAQHRLAVMELETRAQLEGPGLAVVGGLLGLDHLTLRLKLGIDAVERVPDQRRRVAHDILRAPDGIEIGEVGLRHEAQGARRGALCDRRGREAGQCQTARAGQSLQNGPAIHEILPVVP